MERKILIAGMVKLQSIFGGSLDELKLAAYYEALSRLTDSAYNRAVDEICARHKSFPKPADIRELAAAYREPSKAIEHAPMTDRSEKLAQDAKSAMTIMFSDIPREHKVEMFRVLENAYPGLGWAIEGKKLKTYYEMRGLL